MQTYRNPTKTQQEKATLPARAVINSDIKVSPRSSRKSEDVADGEYDYGFKNLFGFRKKKSKKNRINRDMIGTKIFEKYTTVS